MIKNVVQRILAKNFRSAFFYSAVQGAVQQCVSELYRFDAVATRLNDAPTFTLSVTKFVKDEIEKASLEKVKMEKEFDKLAEVVREKSTKVEDESWRKRRALLDSHALRRIFLTTGSTVQRSTVHGPLWRSQVFATMKAVAKRGRRSAIKVITITAPQHLQRASENTPHPAWVFWYQSTRGARKPSTIALTVSSENLRDKAMMWCHRWRICKNVVVQMKDREPNDKYFILVINFFTEFMETCGSPCTHEGTAVWLLVEYMNGPFLSAVKARLNLSSNDAKRYEDIKTTYGKVMSHLLRWYATGTVIEEAGERIQKFKQDSLTPWYFL